jgi:DNA-binding CsgD family transcriptional regulator
VLGSGIFVGRERELSGLRAALGGDTRLLLVTGDAGVGKTRFVAEGLAAAGRPAPAWGACLPLAEKLPLLPVAEVLDALGRLDGGARLDRALAAAAPYARAETARLLPRLQPAGAPAGGRAREWQRERLFSGVAEVLAAAGGPAGLVMVIEDVHWADSATLDFLTFLAAAGRGDAVTVVATCRSDETPLEPQVARWLAHMRGSGGVAEIRLAPLSPREVAAQVAGLMGGTPPAGLAEELYARGEGNPFFTEQLAADALARPEGSGPGLPQRLADLLAARASGCGREAGAALAALAVAGLPLTEDQLRDVAGLGAGELRAGLRELADSRLLAETAADGAYRARHALLAEAVTAGLLPGERRVLHERTAQMLESAGEEALAAEAADHWAAAGRADAELPARTRAATAAERVFGYAEAAVHWQRAIELWPAGPGAGPGLSLPQVYTRAVDALHVSGDGERAGVLAEEAYRRFAGHPDPALDAVIHERAARFRGVGEVFLGGQGALGSGLPLITAALALFEQAPPSAEHAEALFYYGHYLFSGERRREDGLAAVNRGLEIAQAAGATELIPRMLPIPAYYRFLHGQMEEGFAVLRRGRALAESGGDGEALLMIDVYESDALLKTARFGDAADVALRGLQAARAAGLGEFWTAGIVAANAAEALLHQGRTAQAAALVDPLTGGPPYRDHWLVHLFRCEIDLRRGDVEAAVRRHRQIAAVTGELGNIEWSGELAQGAAEVALWAGLPDQALDEVRRTVARSTAPDWAIFCGRLLAAGMRACADLAERARARRDEPAAAAAAAAASELADLREHLAADPFTDHPFSAAIPAHRAGWAAERARLAGASDPAAWSAAASAWADLGCLHRAGYAWWRCAEARLAAGRARAAADAVRAAADAAAGHVPLLAEIRKLAARAHIPLRTEPDAPAAVPHQPAAPYGLTGRELTVLRLVAAGLTNAQIGAELFISPKTASVHVTSILRKLRVAGRVQAAAAAERAGLLDGGPPKAPAPEI